MNPFDQKQEFKKTVNEKSIRQLVEERLIMKPLMVQLPQLAEKLGQILKVDDKGIYIFFKDFLPPMGTLVLSGFIDQHYTEIEIRVLASIKESLFLCRPNYLRISSQRRCEPRYNIDDHETIYAKRIKMSKTELDLDGVTVPLAYKVILENYQSDKAYLADTVIFAPFEKGKGIKGIYEAVRATGKTVFITDCSNPDAFERGEDTNQDILDLKGFYQIDSNEKLSGILKQHKRGWIICPILGPTAIDKWIPIGYIELISNTPFDFSKLMETKNLSYEVIERLRNLRTIEINEKQNILDVSRSGLRIHVTNEDIIKYIYNRPRFTFDIIIKNQAPISVLGWARSTRELQDGSLQVGIKIQGETDRQDQMARYHEFVNILAKKEHEKTPSR